MGSKRTFIDAFGPENQLHQIDTAALYSSEETWDSIRQDYKRVKASHFHYLMYGGRSVNVPEHTLTEENQQDLLGRIRSLAEELFEELVDLNDIFYRCSHIIAQKWREMDHDARVQFLKDIVPMMPSDHKTAIVHTYESLFRLKEFREKWGDPDLTEMFLPHVNVEDLVKGDNLLMFIQSRALSHPGVFRFADFEYSRNGSRLLTRARRTVPERRFMLSIASQNVEGYVTTSFDRSQSTAREHEYQLCSFDIEETRAILIIQRDMTLWLNRISFGLFGGDELPPRDPQRVIENFNGLAAHDGRTLEEHLSQAAFLTPLDALRVILPVLHTREVALHDEILKLRDDPGHFMRRARKYHEQSGGSAMNQSEALAYLCTGPASDMAVLRSLGDQLYEILAEQKTAIVPAELSVPQGEALHKLLVSVIVARSKCEADLDKHVVRSRELKQYFNFAHSDPTSPRSAHQARAAASATRSSRLADTLSLVHTPWADYYYSSWRKYELIREAMALAKLGDTKLPENLYGDLETWATLCVLERDLLMHQPNVTLAGFHKVPADPELEVVRLHRIEREVRDHLREYTGFRHGAFNAIVSATYSRVPAPGASIVTPEQQKLNIEIENHHAAFWDLVDQAAAPVAGEKLDKIFGIDLSNFVPYRTTIAQQLTPAQRAEMLRTRLPVAVPRNIVIGEDPSSPAQVSPTTGRAIQATFGTSGRDRRRSSRPLTGLQELGAPAAGTPEREEAEEPRAPPSPIYLRNKDVRKFSALFVALTPEDRAEQARELSWADFVRIMKAIGFTVDDSEAGSRVRFVPPPNITDGPYVAHMPHGGAQGSSKMEYGLTRAIGKGLTEKYGWTIDTFKPLSERPKQ